MIVKHKQDFSSPFPLGYNNKVIVIIFVICQQFNLFFQRASWCQSNTHYLKKVAASYSRFFLSDRILVPKLLESCLPIVMTRNNGKKFNKSKRKWYDGIRYEKRKKLNQRFD